jgi:uncharacterized protein YqeY
MSRDIIIETAPMRIRIEKALEAAEASGDEPVRLGTLRLIQCALNDRDVCARERGAGEECPEPELLGTLTTMVAQREISAREFDEAGRIEEAIREREEIEVIEEFLPKTLDGPALKLAVREIIDDLGATRLKDLGRCMNALKDRYPGEIDAAEAGKAVRIALAG